MKQTKHILLTAVMLLCSLAASAHGFEVDGIYYNITDEVNLTVEVTYRGEDSYLNEYSGAVTIPSAVFHNEKVYSVTSVGYRAFRRCGSLTSITLPESVTNIKGYAFHECYSLESITIPESVTSIGSSAFDGCSSLSSIVLPVGVTSIDSYAFENCSSLTSINIPANVTNLGHGVFVGCSGLTSIVVAEGNPTYDSRNACNGVIETNSNTLIAGCVATVIPESVTSIGSSAFDGCSSLSSIVLPVGVTSIDSYAFENCSSLTSVYIPESVTSIGSSAFCGCSNLTNIILPAGVARIEDSTFSGCSSLASIIIPEGVSSIENYAFKGCSSLNSITIPKKVEYIGAYAFRECSSLTSIVVDAGNTTYDSRNSCNAIVETNSNTLIAGCSTTIIPENVTNIGGLAFWGCGNLTAITIPESVVYIESGAFAYCSNLVSIVVVEGNSVYDSRENCNAIIETNSNTLVVGCATTVIPASVKIIGERAYQGCTGLTSITIPAGVESIESYAFIQSGLTSIVVDSENSVYDSRNGCNAIIESNSNTLLVGCATTIIPEGVTTIGPSAFYGCRNLSSITIPQSVTYIRGWAFGYCYNLSFIICKATTPPDLDGISPFFDLDKSIPVYAPASSVKAYQSSWWAAEFANIQPMYNEYALTVSSAGYATMYLDYAVEIPKNAEVFIATSVEDDRLKMTRVTGVLPANTGVIVRANAGTYTFIESTDTPANVDGNLLSGTAEATYITAESGYRYYVLAQKEGMVGMYRPKLTDGRFLNNANKAYLRLESDDLGIFDDETNTEDEGGQLSNRLRFDFGGTTEIEQTTVDGGQTMVIYDLTGRRVADTEGLKGVYIVGGKKVIF